MFTRTVLLALTLFLVLGSSQALIAGKAPLPRPQAWVDCELFDSIVTPATFKPESDPFDELYAGGTGFKGGAPLISESKPGDADYNGGRWHMNVLKDGVPEDKYADACKVEDLDLNDFESTGNYFECPLLPIRGRGNRGGIQSDGSEVVPWSSVKKTYR